VGRRGRGGWEAGDPVDGLAAGGARRELAHLALQAEDLADVGEVEVGVQRRAGPDAPAL
jgi:hypothetical protein